MIDTETFSFLFPWVFVLFFFFKWLCSFALNLRLEHDYDELLHKLDELLKEFDENEKTDN